MTSRPNVCGRSVGSCSAWTEGGSDTLGGPVVDGKTDVAKHTDLLVGVVPIVNLEWIQKIHRDNAQRGYSAEAIVDTIMRRMDEGIKYGKC